MNRRDKNLTIQRYSERYADHGYSPASLGWGKGGRQNIRFNALAAVGVGKTSSVLDVGCGFGDLYGHLRSGGWTGGYQGVDIVDALLVEARRQHPGISVKNADILSSSFAGTFDYVVSSGIFNARLVFEKDQYAYIRRMLKKMFALCRKGVAVDFMSSYVDFKKTASFHARPEKIFEMARSLSRRVVVRHDYLPFEFAVYVLKNDSVDRKTSSFV